MYLSPRASITTTCNILNTTAVLFSDPLLQTCIQPTSLSRLWTVQNVSAKTVYGLLNGYLNDVCTAPICNNQTIQSAFDTAFNGCEEVIGNALNGTGIDIEQLSDYIPLLPTIKDAACLVSTENASSINDYFDTKYCSILTVQAYEQAIDRQLNWDFFLGLNSGLISYSALIPNKTSKSTELLCTDCTKSLYNHLRPIGNETASIEANVTSSLTTANVLTTLGKALGDLCGPDFLDGVEPTTVVNGTDTRLLPEMNLATSGAFAVLPSFNRPAAFFATAMLLAISTM